MSNYWLCLPLRPVAMWQSSPILFACSEVKKTSFVEFYDYYMRTAEKLSASLDGQAMQVGGLYLE